MKPRGPTILAIVAVLATFALAFAFLGTGTASASTLSSPGFVATSQLNPSLALPTSNTLADPTVNLVSRDPSGLVVVNQGPDVGYYGSQLHKDQVLGGSNVTTSAANTKNAAIGSTGSLQAVLTNIGINATGIAGMMLAISLVAASVLVLGMTSASNPRRGIDSMVLRLGRVTTRAVTSVVRIFDGMSRTTTPSALTST